MRRSLIFLLLSTVIIRSFSSSELSTTPPNRYVSEIYNSLLPPPLPPEPDVALVAALDGTIHLVDTKLGKIRWSFGTGRPIYSSYQASLNSNASEFYIDVGEDWELYFHSKRFGKMKKLSSSAEEYIRRMPYISKDAVVTLGAMKTSVFLVDVKSGRVVDNYVLDFSSSTLGFQSDENKHVVPVDGYEELVESGVGNLKRVRQLVYIMRTDYVLQSTSQDSGEVLWNVAYADFKAEFRCQEVGKSFSGYHFSSGSELGMDLIGDVESPLPCYTQVTASVYRLRDNSLSEFLSVIGKVAGWISLPGSSQNSQLGPVDRKLPLFLHDKVDRPPLALPSTETEIPWTLGMPDGSVSEINKKFTFVEGFRSYIQSFIVLFIALCPIIGFLFSRSKQDKSKKQTEEHITKTGIPKKKKSRRPGYNKNTTSSEKMQSIIPNERNVGETNGLSHITGNGEKFLLTFTDLIDGRVGGRRIGKLVVCNKEIAKGSNGTVVLEGNYEGRAVAVKRLVKTHHDVALKEIQNLIASDQHPNIVRWYGVESDQDFVYLSLERCTCNLNDLIYVLSGSFENQLNAKEQDSNLLNEVRIRLIPVMENTKDIELWKANGHPSAQLLKLMRDIVSGLSHLHEIGLIHRDLKPQNVLIIKDKSFCAKLSDMGISKRLQGDMSSLTQNATGYGSSGWQAPEQLLQGRQTRAMDLFGLGCILFFCITGGKHPYGESFERDANIVKDQKDLFLVEHIPEAVDLFTRLLDPNPDLRPKAQNVLYHPFFWTSDTRLSFLRDVSDRVELEDRESDSKLLKALEGIAPVALNGKWDEKMETKFIENIGRYRRYKYDNVRDLLRVIRNKSNHYRELPQDIQELLGSHPEGFYDYFSCRFPKLLIEVYNVIFRYCST